LFNDVLRKKLAQALEIPFVEEKIDAEAEMQRIIKEFEEKQKEEVKSSC